MNENTPDCIQEQFMVIIDEWLTSCTRKGKVSRNTVAVGIVVLDHLLQKCPRKKSEVISDGGEIKGARSGLSEVLQRHNLPVAYLKEATTRQVHQDGQRLLEDLEWGGMFDGMATEERERILKVGIARFTELANEWLKRKNLALDFDVRHSPLKWLRQILESAKSNSGGIVEQHLVGAKLAYRFNGMTIPNHPAHAADVQTGRDGDFRIDKTVFHVTAAPSIGVIEKCSANIRAGLRPILIVPDGDAKRDSIAFARSQEILDGVTIISIEDFIALNVIEVSSENARDYFDVFKEIIDTYNTRLDEVETDKALLISLSGSGVNRGESASPHQKRKKNLGAGQASDDSGQLGLPIE